jgi:hypothetical protein
MGCSAGSDRRSHVFCARFVVAGGFILNLVRRCPCAGAAPRRAHGDVAVGDSPAPIAPATVVRANGRVVVRAIHLSEPLVVDGKLDEAALSRQPAD